MRNQILADMVLVAVLTIVVGAIWYFGTVRPRDRFLRDVEVCMDGDPQAYWPCVKEVRSSRR